MFAIRNKKNGELFRVIIDTESYDDIGGWEITWQTYTRAVMTLKTGKYPGVVFLTDDENIIKELLEKGKTTNPYPIRLDLESDWSWRREKTTLADLKAVRIDTAKSFNKKKK